MRMSSWAWVEDEIQQLVACGLYRQRGLREGPQGAEIFWNSRRVLNFGSNDYLGLAGGLLNPAVSQQLPSTGWGAGASPLVTGRSTGHEALEHALATFEHADRAILFPTGFAANVGVVAALAGRGDIVFSDSKNHASIIDGCRLSGARVQVFPHVQIDSLEKYLAQASGFRRRLIVTDGLFSMDGDLAPLDAIADLAERYDAMLVVDEAHATGVLGDEGRGTCEYFGVEDRVTARVGTLSKALGSHGGFVVGPEPVVDWLYQRARPYVFSTAAPDCLAAAGLEALRIVQSEPQRRRTLLARASEVREKLKALGWVPPVSPSQIIPVIAGSADRTMALAARLLERGIFVPGIRPPTVPEGESLLRISLTSEHTTDMLDRLLEALAELATI